MAHSKNPNEIVPLSEESKNIIRQVQTNFLPPDDFVHVGPKRYMCSKLYEKYKDEIYNFQIKNTDVWVNSYGRSGTTVTQEMVWQICNNLDFEKASKTPLIERFPFFEFAIYHSEEMESFLQKHANDPKKCASIKKLFTLEWEKTKVPEKRFFKSHLPLSLLPAEITKVAKIVYTARNPKDMAVSGYHFIKMYEDPPKFKKYWNLWERDLMLQQPYFEHIIEAWNIRNKENIFFLFYEDFVKDIRGTVVKLCKFFGKTYSDAQIDKLVDHLKIDNFRNNSSVNRDYFDYYPPKVENFVRRGKVDSHKDEVFTNELSKKADKWIQEQYKKTDMRFPNIPY
ncbi:unnamed protein product [Brassicogethes aeneus]|uniref:Sulfotransferase domain-containing protein n=1 Tax=Brassicogethes aeneus TaxID=1431903 RepID=A0A9P0B7G9_BRAAE|nr:unnamed protein product [Brassicogethes aeneus]